MVIKLPNHLGQYVLLNLGNQFSAGKIVRTGPYMVTLEVSRGKRKFRPGYRWDTIHQMVPISRKIAEALGRFSYPPMVGGNRNEG